MCQAMVPSCVPVTTTCAELMEVLKWMRADTGSTDSGLWKERERAMLYYIPWALCVHLHLLPHKHGVK